MKRIILSFSFLTIGFAATSQTMIIKDISAGTNGSFPNRLTSFGNNVVFFANDMVAGYGMELSSMDSAGNVAMAYNINPGAASGGSLNIYLKMAVLKNMVYFPANDGTHGIELFSWDGANAPTLVADLYPGNFSSNIGELIAYNDKLYFTASTSATGTELWVHDPVKKTTEILSDLNPGNLSATPQNLTLYNNKLYFTAFAPTSGRELHMYDSKTNSVKIVADIYPDASSSDPQSLVVGNSRLYFSAMDATYGRELYCIFDTTVTRLTDVYAGVNSSISNSSAGQNRIGILNGLVYFGANDGSSGIELYKYDHKTKISSLAYKINPLGSSAPSSFTRFSNKLCFTANDGVHGLELWSIDGSGSPSMVVDIDTAAGASGNPNSFLVHGDGLYFAASESEFGSELYVYRDPAVGIQKMSFDAEVKVYPNPTSNFTNIELKLNKNESLAIRVTDMSGREVYNTGIKSFNAGINAITIPMHSLTTGMYFYSINNGAGSVYVKGKITKE